MVFGGVFAGGKLVGIGGSAYSSQSSDNCRRFFNPNKEAGSLLNRFS
jgi:hypothetical protein